MKKILSLLLVTVAFTQTNWKVDKSHSTIGFSIDHLVISEVDGKFTSHEASIESKGEDFSDAKITIEIDPSSVNTSNERRDNHLRSADFFDVEKFKEIKFVSTSMKKTGARTFALKGNLTIHGITKPVELKAHLKGFVDAFGGRRAGFKIEGEIDRYAYELRYGKALETGGLVIGQMVRLNIVLELIKK